MNTTSNGQHGVSRLFAEGVARYEAGDLAEAGRLLQRVLELDRSHAGAHLLSAVTAGVLAIQADRVDEAVAHYRRALSLQPGNPGLHMAMATIHRLQGNIGDAAACYKKALELDPSRVDAHNGLGDTFLADNNLDDALVCYARAVDVAPDDIQSLCNLSYVFSKLEQYRLAAKWLRRALEVDPDNEIANWSLISVLEYDSRLAEAQFYRDRVRRPRPLIIEAAPEPRRTVLILCGAGSGMVPYPSLVPRPVNTRLIWYVDCATDQQEAELPPHDVVFNAIGNAEVMAPALPRLTRFAGHHHRPVLNPPERVASTRRDRMPTLLAGIPDVVVPPVTRLRREEAGAGLAARLAAAGVTCPLLARPISGQGGRGVSLVETPERLAELDLGDADAFYFIGYHDYRSPDGYYRKYRTIFVDRQPYHYHLAISPRWLVHYFSAEMRAEPWKREEERRFLDNPAAAIGQRAVTAVEAIGRRMDLDYAGIDYSILPDGRVLVFEANATMAVVPAEADGVSASLDPALAIFAAFEAMLERHGAAAEPLTSPAASPG